jgi:hypothetical protein
MSLRYTIDRAARVVRLDYDANPSFPDAKAALRTIVVDPAYEPGFSFLVDRRQVGPPSTEYVRRLVAFVEANQGAFVGSRWALVAPSPVLFGMGRMSQLLSAKLPISVEVFGDVESAEAWLLGGFSTEK